MTTTSTTDPTETPEQVAALLADDEAAGPATPADVDQAEAEAAEAAALVEALEDRVRNGDDTVTPEEIAQAEQLGRFARLRAEATRRKAEKTARAVRLRALDQLRAEMEAYATDTGDRYAALLAAAEKAVTEFLTVVQQRNDRIKAWRQRMWDHQVPRHGNPLIPPAEHAHLGHNDQGEVIAGRRRLRALDPGPGVLEMLQRAVTAAGADPLALRCSSHSIAVGKFDPNDTSAPYARLRAVDAPAGDPDPNLRFFLTVGGAVLEMDHEPNEVERLGIEREITRREAWGA